MTGRFWLDWAIIAASLFNTILLLWLGLIVLLNANRRDWGVWLMGGGLLGGALFFISHSAMLGQDLAMNLDGLNFWWRAGWFPVTVSPFAWYVAVLWFSGFWAAAQSSLKRRHRAWLWLMVLWLAGLITLLLVANPIPAYDQLVQFDWSGTLAVRNIRLLFLLFPLWMIACILLSIDVLRRPAEVENANTKTARQRALPWLLGAAGTLLAVALVVAYFVGSVVAAAGTLNAIRMETVAAYDLALSLLIALAALSLGQSIVSYEIFTGRVLPRRSFIRQWRNAILLASGYAVVVGWSLSAHLRPIYSLLLATLLLTLFYALYGWRSFREREQFVARLRPFVQSQGISPNPLHANASAGSLLAALCHDVLGTAHAQLIPLGSVAPLVSTTLSYPQDAGAPPMRPPRDLHVGMTPLDTAVFAPYGWAISLWNERERIGVLLIGEKLDGGLYSEEEMDTAQAAGERIVHLLAGEQMVLRLMELQRKRTAEQRVMDLRTRRALHDEILPALHLAILQLNGVDRQQPAIQESVSTLGEAHQQIADLLAHTQPAPARAPDTCEIGAALRGLIQNEFAYSFEQIVYRDGMNEDRINGEHTAQERPVDRVYVDPVVGEVVLGAAREAVRNAAAHGRGGKVDRPLCLRIGFCTKSGEFVLTIADNGVGIDAGRVNAASSLGGSGNGLALHSTLLAMVGGYLTVESPAEGGTLVRIAVPKSEY
ncbi:MAG: ATP-binding protein [Caldilineaceae bacterium]|nr:ATP-binding protein [Caldilineaceae bacterium]